MSASSNNKQQLVPVLSVSTNGTGSHRTLFAVGTRADSLAHDYDKASGTPTYAEGVYVEMIPKDRASEVGAAGADGLHFSSAEEFNDWLISSAGKGWDTPPHLQQVYVPAEVWAGPGSGSGPTVSAEEAIELGAIPGTIDLVNGTAQWPQRFFGNHCERRDMAEEELQQRVADAVEALREWADSHPNTRLIQQLTWLEMGLNR